MNGQLKTARRSGIYMPCRACGSNTATGSLRVCRTCSIRKCHDEIASAVATRDGITIDQAIERLEYHRATAPWRAELRRLAEVARLRKLVDL